MPWWLGVLFYLPLMVGASGGSDGVTLRFLSSPDYSVINATTPGMQDNKWGIEDGLVVKLEDGSYHLITAEMIGDPMWVKVLFNLPPPPK